MKLKLLKDKVWSTLKDMGIGTGFLNKKNSHCLGNKANQQSTNGTCTSKETIYQVETNHLLSEETAYRTEENLCQLYTEQIILEYTKK